MMRRRCATVLTLVGALAGMLVLDTGLAHSSTQPGRQHVLLRKMCPPQLVDPLFTVENVSEVDEKSFNDNTSWAPEMFTVVITKRAQAPAYDVDGDGDLEGTNPVVGLALDLAPGETRIVQATGVWRGAHYAHVYVMYRGAMKILTAKQTCHCDDQPPPTSSTTPDTQPPT